MSPSPVVPPEPVNVTTRHQSMTVSLLIASACLGTAPAEPEPIGEGRRALFIGNSYLYTLDIPGIVQALADSAGGDKIAVATVAGPNLALIDHWRGAAAREAIARGGWEWVVLQQGPSSVEVNRDSLRLVARLFADDIAKVGAQPALFSAWPTADRTQDFPRAIESYTLAAADVNGLLLPVASAWLAAWSRDPALQLYADGLHASAAGAYLSALVIYSRLLGKTPIGLPARVQLRSGVVISIPSQTVAVLQAAAAEVTQFSVGGARVVK
jgi:hypothetical protein